MSYMHLDPITSTEVLGPNVSDVSVPHESNAVTGIICSMKIFNPE